jgi:hypothetical protein
MYFPIKYTVGNKKPLKEVTSYKYLKIRNFRLFDGVRTWLIRSVGRRNAVTGAFAIWSRTVGQGVQNRAAKKVLAVVRLPQAFRSAKRGRRIL